MFPFLSVAESPEAMGKNEQRALTAEREYTLASKENPAWFSEGTAELLPHQGLSKSHRSSNDGKRSTACIHYTYAGSCILKHGKTRTDVLLFLPFQTS